MYCFKIEEKINTLDPLEIKKAKQKYGEHLKFEEKADGILATFNFDASKPVAEAGIYKYNPPLLDWYATTQKDNSFTIPVKIAAGITLKIMPAIALPRKVYFSSGKIDESEIYPRKFEYGKLAYEVYDELIQGKELPGTDERIIRLVGLALKHSYHCPLEIVENEELLSPADLQIVVGAALGIPEEALREELKKFS